jgi:hypothetical protein
MWGRSLSVHDLLCMDGIADHPKRSFQISISGLEGVGIDRQGRPEPA